MRLDLLFEVFFRFCFNFFLILKQEDLQLGQSFLAWKEEIMIKLFVKLISSEKCPFSNVFKILVVKLVWRGGRVLLTFNNARQRLGCLAAYLSCCWRRRHSCPASDNVDSGGKKVKTSRVWRKCPFAVKCKCQSVWRTDRCNFFLCDGNSRTRLN